MLFSSKSHAAAVRTDPDLSFRFAEDFAEEEMAGDAAQGVDEAQGNEDAGQA